MSASSRRPTFGASAARAWRTRYAALRSAQGYILIEMLIAAAILIVGLVGLFALLDATVKTSAATRAREGAANLARQVLEDAHTVPFAQMSPSSIVAELQAKPGLADASAASGWQVVQRKITYTITVTECSVDDPKDGHGAHVSSTGENPFCSDSSTTGSADSQPEDLKRVGVDVKWTAQGRNPDVHQVETLTAAGVAPGLAASNLHLISPFESTEPAINSPVYTSLTFGVTAPASTTAMRWSLEGAVQATAPTKVSETQWTFSWAIPYRAVSDGTYTVSIQAIDATGVVGPPASITVILIRGFPLKVEGLVGGFSHVYVGGVRKEVAELEWNFNSERNVIGYNVFNPSHAVVCKETTAADCIDFSPPEQSAANLEYTARALYRNYEGNIAEGEEGGKAFLSKAPIETSAPRNLKAVKNADGTVTLTWEKPETNAAAFYRIYRDSLDYTSRQGEKISSPTTTWTDNDAAVAHKYWVTAVSSTLTESLPSGEVVRMIGRLRAQDGFTMIELLVAMTAMLLVFGAVLAVFESFQRDTRYGQLRNEAQDNARNAVDRLARELRNVAAPESEAGGALEVAEKYAVTFQTIDASKTSSGANAKNVMRVRYCLDDSTPTNEVLWRQYKRWTTEKPPAAPTATACPDNTAGNWEGKQKLATRLVNRNGGKKRPVFEYGPKGATGISEYTTVEPSLYLDLSPGSRPGETQLTSAISLRNENRKPTASFSAKEIGAKKVLLNASESTDPDGLALAYKWRDNGALLESTAQQVETKALESKSTHVFKLEVEDPGGLKATAEQTVVIK